MNDFTNKWINIQNSYKANGKSIHPRNWPGGNKVKLNTCKPRKKPK